MDQEPVTPHQRSRTRENVLIIALVLFLGGIMLFFLDLISMGLFTNAIVAGGAIIGVGCFHYMVWGRALSEEVAIEREAMLLKEEQEAESRAHPEGIQDLTRTRAIKRGRPQR